MAWPTGEQKFGVNRAPLLSGLDSATGNIEVPIAVNSTTGAVLTSSSGGSTVLTDGVTTSIKATVADLTNSNPLAVEIVDGTGNQITSFGGGTQYAEGATTSPATGTVALGRYLTADPTLTANQLYGLRFDVNGRAMVNPAALSSANDSVSAAQSGAWAVAATQSGIWKQNPGTTTSSTLTSVAGANTTTQLLASNTSRSGAYFYNDSTQIAYLAFASTASTTAYTIQIQPNQIYEMPVIPVYTGIISCIWTSANGSMRITETS